MKISTRSDAIKIIVEMSEEEALELARLIDAQPSIYAGFRMPVMGKSIHDLSRDLNNAVSKGRAEATR